MRKNIRKEFVEEIRKALPDDMNAAIYLTGELRLGKETVYRRLRGTVPFSLDEAAEVARELGISLDRLAGLNRPENPAYEFNINYSCNFDENYAQFALGTLNVLRRVANDPGGIYITAANKLPWPCYLDYRALATFRYKRWLYERGEICSFRTEDLAAMPYDYVKAQADLMDAFRRIRGIYMIWDENVFSSLVKEIKYFRKLAMITDEEIGCMRTELLDILDQLEELMIKGHTRSNGKIYFYLSNVNFDSTYSYMEAKGFQTSIFHVYSVHQIDSSAPEICTLQKTWLHTILRHSTLITQCGEIERAAFLKEQRELVKAL